MFYRARNGGIFYVKRWALSLNEGQFPNIHVSWDLLGDRKFYFYVALSRRFKWWRA